MNVSPARVPGLLAFALVPAIAVACAEPSLRLPRSSSDWQLAGEPSIELRGSGCRLADAQQGAEIPEQCRFYQAIVDAEPSHAR